MVAETEIPSPGNWGWKRNKTVEWLFGGHCCQKLLMLAWNSSIVGARKDAGNNASVARLHSDVLHSVYAMASVLKIRIQQTKLYYRNIITILSFAVFNITSAYYGNVAQENTIFTNITLPNNII